MNTICKNPWCKAPFSYRETDMDIDYEGDRVVPKFCKKCISFDSELSAGVMWEDTEPQYMSREETRIPNEIKYRVTKYR
jgi:hypothetical protein